MSKITFENKEQLNTNENIPAKNKCMASDLNEIKEVVNENDTNALYNTNIKTTEIDSDTDTYSCNYINKITKKNIMMINLDDVQTITTDVETKVLFNKINFQLGDKLTFESNGIKIGAGVSKVRIDLTLWLEGRSADTYGAFYIVNSRTGALTYNLKAYDGKIVWDTANAYIYANVQEGDIIFANVRFSVAGNTNAVAGNYTNSCLLSVEVVE